MKKLQTWNELKYAPGVYKIEHIKSGKLYIGKSKNLLERFSIHQSHLRHDKHDNVYLQRAWNKHGEKQFIFTVIRFCPEEELLRIEQEQLDFWWPTGLLFNISRNVKETPRWSRAVRCWDKEWHLVGDFNSLTEASKKFGIYTSQITEACQKDGKTAGGMYWGYLYGDDGRAPARKRSKFCKRVKYTLDNKTILTFESLGDAAEYAKVCKAAVFQWIRGGGSNNFTGKWDYINEHVIKKPRRFQTKAVDCYSMGDIFICSYNSIGEAAADHNMTATHLVRVCNGGGYTSGGHKWTWKGKPLITNKTGVV